MQSVIIAGGYGTRMLPISKIIAKEMMPIGDKPTIQYIVDGITSLGIKNIIILNTEKKKIIENRFKKDIELEKILKEKNEFEMLESITKPRKIAKYKFVKQKKRLGTGGAILDVKKLIKDDFFMVNFGDAIYDKKDFSKLLKLHIKTKGAVLGAISKTGNDSGNHGLIEFKGNKLIKINENRENNNNKEFYIRDGFCILPKEIFGILEKIKKMKNGKKFRLADGINELAKNNNLHINIIKNYRDIGNINKRLKANNKFYEDGRLF